MKKIIFDTSVYGELIKDIEIADIIAKHIPKEFVIYGNKIIRDELRDTSKKIKIGNKSKRILLLGLYDSFVRKDHHNLKYNKLIETLAQDYFNEYKKQKGGFSSKSINNDFIIIATATIYQMDIVVSKDKKSMLGDKAIKSYEIINKSYGLKDPKFELYNSFKNKIKRFYQYGN